MEVSNAVKIASNASGLLTINLDNVLKCVKEGKEFNWSILWLEATGDIGSISMLEYEKKIKREERGLLIDWEDLFELSGKFYQIIDLILIGDKDSNNLRRYKDDNNMYSTCYYVIELIDSSYWLIHSKDADLLNCIKNKLSGISYNDIE